MKIPDDIKEFSQKSKTKAFATIDKNGNPNVVAIGSIRVINDNTVWVFDTFFKKTLSNIKQDNRVALCMWSGREGYQLKGTVRYISDKETVDKAMAWILKRRPNKLPIKGVVEIKITEIYSITSSYEEAGKRIC